MVDPSAPDEVHEVPADEVADLQRTRGWTVESIEGRVDRVADAQREDEYGGIVGGIAATGAGILRGATGGLSDVAYAALGEGDTLRNLEEVNPGLSTVGEIGGAVGGVLTGGTVASGINQLGARVASRGGVGAAVAGGVVEGGLSGLGSAVSELALSEEPLTIERAASAISSSVLFGGAIGGVAAGGVRALERGLVKAKGALDAAAASRASAVDIGEDIAAMDGGALSLAREAEVEALVSRQVVGRASMVDELRNYQAVVKDTNPFLVVTDGESAALLSKTKKSLRGLMDDPEGLAKDPAKALKALRVQREGVSRALADHEAITAKLGAQNKKLAQELSLELDTMPDALDSVTLSASSSKRYGAYADVKVPKGGAVLSRSQATEFLDALRSGRLTGSADEAFKKMPAMLDANRALQQKIESLSLAKGDLTSPRLSSIDAARANIGAPRGTSEQMLTGAAFSAGSGAAYYAGDKLGIPPAALAALAPLVGARAAGVVGSKVFGRLGKTASAAADRTSKAVGVFLDVTRKVAPVAPVIATKVLQAVAFGPRDKDEPTTLPKLYAKRAKEIRERTEPGADGRPVMRAAARQEMAAQLAGVRAGSPILADRMESAAARRLEFLASKIPKRPDLSSVPTGPDTWQPSDMEMRQFARYVAGVEDPGGIAERLAGGSITPEDAQVMREVYPEQLADLTRQLLEQLPMLQKTLPYQRRLALSILTGAPVDPAMNPRILSVFQSMFATEPGTEGGIQAPVAQAQFGSVRAAPGTLSQRREGVPT